MKTLSISITAIFFILFGTACIEEEPVNDQFNKIDLDEKSEQLVEADNQFGLDLFARINANEETPENFMISPLSVSLALAMTYNGAEGETKAAMEDALRLSRLSRDEINAAYKSLVDALLTVDPKVVIEIANSIWYRNTFEVEPDFLDVNHSFYNSEVYPANFADPATVDLINNWVSDKTHEKIPQIITEIEPHIVMFLINAIYFNGSWSKEFNPEGTQQMSFRTTANAYVQVDMMRRMDTLNYLHNETFSAIELNYGQGNYNMMVMLPNFDKTVGDVVAQMTPDNWAAWQSDFEKTNSVDINLPKFKLEFEIKLNDILKAMGMEIAFSGDADFTGINKAGGLFIDYVKHKTFIEVDEEGTEAAAVTVVAVGKTSIDPNQPIIIPFHCDRPFMYAITEKSTGAILFIGKVGDPTAPNN